ncbi:MAG: fimbrillin family protein [Tannerellaceae bacterium]|jgi:hypothetical protein|nr:fimbrillin family protein [Tannerellaceae bacterium]
MNKNTFLKRFLPLASAILLLGSCSEDKTVPGDSAGQAIVFRVQNTLPSSRAAGTTVSQINAFVVNAQADADVPDNERVVMDGVTVSRTESSANSYDYNPKRYYPDAAASVSVSASSPVSKNIGEGFKNNQDNKIAYTVPAPVSSGLASQEDLLVAHTGVAKTGDNFSGAVVLQFRHALSRVYVKAANYLGEPVRVTGLGLHNLYTQGTLDIDATDWNDTDEVDINEVCQSVTSGDNTSKYKTLWTPSGSRDGRYDYVLAEAEATVPARTVNPIMLVSREQGMLVLPQTTKNKDNDQVANTEYGDGAGDFYLRVAYYVSNYDDELLIPFSDLNGLDEGLTFEMGRQYALTLSFAENESGGPISVNFQLEVEEWDTTTTVGLITYASNNKSNQQLSYSFNPVNEQLIPACAFTPETDDIFIGWNTLPDGSGTMYNSGEKVQFFTEVLTLYAIWQNMNYIYPASGQAGSITYVTSQGWDWEDYVTDGLAIFFDGVLNYYNASTGRYEYNAAATEWYNLQDRNYALPRNSTPVSGNGGWTGNGWRVGSGYATGKSAGFISNKMPSGMPVGQQPNTIELIYTTPLSGVEIDGGRKGLFGYGAINTYTSDHKRMWYQYDSKTLHAPDTYANNRMLSYDNDNHKIVFQGNQLITHTTTYLGTGSIHNGKTFLNGSQVTPGQMGSAPPAIQADGGIFIGGYNTSEVTGSVVPPDWTIHSLRVYNRALLDDEIQKNAVYDRMRYSSPPKIYFRLVGDMGAWTETSMSSAISSQNVQLKIPALSPGEYNIMVIWDGSDPNDSKSNGDGRQTMNNTYEVLP